MKATDYFARAWLLKNRQRLERARQAPNNAPSDEDGAENGAISQELFEALCGPWGRMMP
jgi:hypothetical protein